MTKNDNSPPCKKGRVDVDSTSAAWKIMRQMGHIEGKGLGLNSQGRTDPVEASGMQSRRGLGLKGKESEAEKPKTKWTMGMDIASASGDLVATLEGERLFLDDLTGHLTVGERLLHIDDQKRFCDPSLLEEMVKCKTLLDNHSMFTDGRSRSNPYEKIGAGIFLNRAAMKMANLDYLTGSLFTKTENDETFFFADICAGPGGFTEYMLWRRPMQSCGFGFTLREDVDFKLKDILCGPVECFHPSYGKNEDGDITNEDNLRKFQQEVMASTDNIGVHTVTADGGFSVEGRENIQEILSKQIYLCQFLCAINILRRGGNFTCKLFDTLTDFSIGLIYIVSTLFSQTSIVKPITSRPANSERYIIFQDFINNTEGVELIRNYLYDINRQLIDMKGSENDVTKIVRDEVLKKDKTFSEFIREINNRVLQQQIIALVKLDQFIIDRNLIDDRQTDIRIEALELWNVPDSSRDVSKSYVPPTSVQQLVSVNYRHHYDGLKSLAKKNVGPLLEAEFTKSKFVLRNHCAGFVSQSISELKESTYVVVKDKKFVNWYPQVTNARPDRLNQCLGKWPISIPSFTILLVHFAVEYSGDKGNFKRNSVVVVDAPLIYGEDISGLSYHERMKKVTNMCNLIDPKRNGSIRPLETFPLRDTINYLNNRSSIRQAKGLKEQCMVTLKNQHFFVPSKLVIINTVNSPWMIAKSRSGGYTYFYNVESHQSVVEVPDGLNASYSESRIHEIEWTVAAAGFGQDRFMKCLQQKLSE